MRRLTHLRQEIEHWQALHQQRDELQGLLGLAQADGDTSMVAEVKQEAVQLAKTVEQFEL